jgi:hypothetical protein
MEVFFSLGAMFLFGFLGFLSNMHEPARVLAMQLYLAAAAGTLAFSMYPRLLMWGIIGKLHVKAAAAKKVKSDTILSSGGDGQTHELVQEWGTWNMYRAILPLISAVVGLWACISHIEGQ